MYINASNLLVTLNLFAVILCEYCNKEDSFCDTLTQRHIFYDVNPPEGFNLRRDVYIRYAVFVHNLQKHQNINLNNFKLVLPPWSHLYHWKRKDEPEYIPWSKFFDLHSLKLFVPVIEMHEYFQTVKPKNGVIVIDEVYVLQHFEDMFKTGNFEERLAVENCQNEIETNFFFYKNMTSKNMRCLSFHGHTSLLTRILETSKASSILFDHAEVSLHDTFGDSLYWQARRSMRFNTALRNIANDFRKQYLNSSDGSDRTFLQEDWRNEKPKRTARGGPYLAVHLRRKDFVWGRGKQVPSISGAARQIAELLEKYKLEKVFIATDTSAKMFQQLQDEIGNSYNVFRYTPTESVFKEYGDGGVAIIDQIVCSYARYFTGTHESTFSFRIQEEREILGFPVDMTFNRLCGDQEEDCQPPSAWKIVY